MTDALEAALHNSPDGVTVITSCSKGEQSIELDYYNTQLSFDTPGVKGTGVDLHGSFFLSMLHAASIAGRCPRTRSCRPRGRPSRRTPGPVDEGEAGRGGPLQVPGPDADAQGDRQEAGRGGRFNAAEPAPPRFEFPIPPPSADPRAVMAIVREVQLPPVKSFREDAPPPSISDVLPFSEETLKDYLAGELKPGTKPTEFHQAILDAVTGMRTMRTAGGSGDLPEQFGGETNDKAKDELRKVQEVPARVEAELQDYLDELEKVADQRDKQPKRWQVHFDYVVAQLKLRICYANQYNLALANVRSGKLPDLQPGQNSYRLTAETNLDKNTPANYKEMFTEARKALTEIAKGHPNTPWAVLAKSDRTVAIGLRLTGGTVGTR